MRDRTEIICPLSGGNLVYTGATSDGYVHFYESETNQGIRYRRYRLDWTVLELRGGDMRFFYINGSEAIEVAKIGDKWLTLNATEEEKEKARTEHSKRVKHAMQNMQFPTIKNMSPKLMSDSIQPVLPSLAPTGKTLFIQTVTHDDEVDREVVDRDARPNVSVDICPLVEYITGKVGTVTNDNLDEIRTMYDDDEILVGDIIYAWDMGGWSAMSGRSGESIFRGDEYIASKLLKMS